jgi:hypothetical protein
MAWVGAISAMKRHEFPLRAAHSRRHASGYRQAFAAALALTTAVALDAATTTPAEATVAGASLARPVPDGPAPRAAIPALASSRPLQANDHLPLPDWWDGPCDVDDNSISYRLAANFDGLQACGPGSDQSGYDYPVEFFPGAWGEYEWECVELSMRWMYQAWGVDPYPADGNGVVADYPNGKPGYPTLTIVKNGTKGEAPQPGDVLSIDNGDGFGHTEVVTSSAVNASGDGTGTAITENASAGSNGWAAFSVTDWVVYGEYPQDTVLGWLHNPAWLLEEPVLWDLNTRGDVQINDADSLSGTFTTVAGGIAQADVIGGDGYAASPIVVALTKRGELEGGYYLPGLAGPWLEPIAPNVTYFAVSAAPDANGHPVLAWLTTSGVLEVSDGGLAGPPIEEATGAAAIALAPNSGPSNPFIGYVSTTGTFYDRQGPLALDATRPWTKVATGVSSIALAGGDMPKADAIEAYTRAGAFFARQGMAGPFTAEATDVGQIAAAAVGPNAEPLLAYVSENVARPQEEMRLSSARTELALTGGILEVEEGPVTSGAFSEQATGVTSVSVAAAMSDVGFPIVGAIATGEFETEDGLLERSWTKETTGISAAGVAALTVS